jgi:hypothetical protein
VGVDWPACSGNTGFTTLNGDGLHLEECIMSSHSRGASTISVPCTAIGLKSPLRDKCECPLTGNTAGFV